ncbi:MAG: hypothetical protein AB8F65_04865 [Woeseiaceae bacterium]
MESVDHKQRWLAADLVVVVFAAAFSWLIFAGNTTGCCYLRNLLPLAAAVGGYLVLSRRGPFNARFWFAWAGFCIPALGLSVYLHMAFYLDWQQIASEAVTPALLFRYLPAYVLFAGLIGSSIGWIVGRGIVTHR